MIKKILAASFLKFVILFSFGVPTAFASTYFSINPVNVTSPDTPIAVTSLDWSNLRVYVFSPGGTSCLPPNTSVAGNCGYESDDENFSLNGWIYSGETADEGNWHYVAVAADDDSTCNSSSYSACLASSGYLGQDEIVNFNSSGGGGGGGGEMAVAGISLGSAVWITRKLSLSAFKK